MTLPPAITVENLTKIYRVPSLRRSRVVAVDHVSFTVAAGEVYGLIGPNGSGKSTTMKALLGLVRPTSGLTRIFGIPSNRVASRSQVGFLPENPYFYRHLTAAETLIFYGRLCRLDRRLLRRRSEELLELVGLEEARNRRLAGFSKGMLQRIGLAQALVQDPRLLVLDEPTAGVDPAGSRGIRDLIVTLRDRGITVILCSHLLEQVQEVCDRVGIMHRGRLVREGPLADLVSLQNQTEVVLENAGPALIQDIQDLVQHSSGPARLLRIGNPRASLEEFFLAETQRQEEKPSHDA
ncbi:MAG TPA: ABC transporter ATP-binding protein [Verrucomicrobiales bacterium]|nr:ABC transporter ATP-binding protein [Verrucomicrobiales bacterium]